RGAGKWSVSSIADRTIYPAPGLLGGGDGALGEVSMDDGHKLHAKALKDLKESDVVHVNLPGGGGYGDPFARDPQRVLWDVIEGYVTAEVAERRYGVAIRYDGAAKDLVKLAAQWRIDDVRTKQLRAGH
ncbi:MAG TPA: hydantoinase B/oxoprolinase family protein, partial [Candidatus Binatus sp.]|nr:hydantoinase B/oxoprolinase family protein [Candidatus Binatus sp.]